MFWVIDLIIILIVALCAFIGYKKGLTGSIVKIISFLLSIILALVLFMPTTNLIINTTQIDEKMETAIVETFINDEQKQEKDNAAENGNPIINFMNEEISKSTEQLRQDAIKEAAKAVTEVILNIIVIILIFIIVRIIMIFIKSIADAVTELPVIKQFDKAGGIIYGLLQAAIIIYVALVIISIITPITGNTLISDLIEKSYIGNLLYKNNLILMITF